MMREILTGSNRLRDEARAALPAHEKAMLLDSTAVGLAAGLAG